MVNLTLKFVACLRTMDLRVSTSEVLDCIGHLELIDVLDEPRFKTILRTNFVKSHRDQSLFDHLYDLFFHHLNSDKKLDETPLEQDGNDISLVDLKKELIEKIEESTELTPITEAILDFLSGDPEAYLKMLNKIQTDIEVVKGKNSNWGKMAERLNVMLEINRIRDMVPRFSGDNESSAPREMTDALKKIMDTLLDNAYLLLVDEPIPNNSSINVVKSSKKLSGQLGDIPFANLTQKQVEDMRSTIDHLVRKLNDMVSRRTKSRSRGVLDIKKTLRKSAKYQGVPIELVFKNNPPGKGKVVTLCDVSGSVWSTARFMLNMLYSLQDCFSKVKSFVFISEVSEVTEFFETCDINEAISKIMSEADISYESLTDYGSTLKNFKDHHMNTLDKKTTLIIIGDGRSNYMNPQEHIFGEMREKVRRIIWLNPEPEQFWRTGDSAMNTYIPYCHEARVCQNLNQLTDFIEELIL